VIDPTPELRRAAYDALPPEVRIAPAELDVVLAAVLAVVYCPDPHLYLSTGCLHDTEEGHAFCRVEAKRYDGTTKTASRCKFCPAPCACSCHREAP
jgi:hypothetical protein